MRSLFGPQCGRRGRWLHSPASANDRAFAQYVSKDCKTQQACSVAFPVVAVGARLEIRARLPARSDHRYDPNVVEVHLDVFESLTVKAVYAMCRTETQHRQTPFIG